MEKAERVKVCVDKLGELEADLRHGEAHEALETLRQGLQIRTMTNHFCVRNFTG
jgi:hypothetical protein